MTQLQNDLIECPVCGGSVARVRGITAVQVGSRSVDVDGEFSTCASCGEKFFGPGEMDDLLRHASSVVRADEGLLQPEEIRAIREGMGLSQPEFERLLGVGAKTVIRWEKGTVFQNGATDSLLRLLRDVPSSVAYLSARAGLSAWTYFVAPSTVNIDLGSWGLPPSPEVATTYTGWHEPKTFTVPDQVAPSRLVTPALAEAA